MFADSSMRENMGLVRAEVFLLVLSAAGLLFEFGRKRRAAGRSRRFSLRAIKQPGSQMNQSLSGRSNAVGFGKGSRVSKHSNSLASRAGRLSAPRRPPP